MYNNFPLYLNLEVKNLHKIDILMLNKATTITFTCLRVIHRGECNRDPNQTSSSLYNIHLYLQTFFNAILEKMLINICKNREEKDENL